MTHDDLERARAALAEFFRKWQAPYQVIYSSDDEAHVACSWGAATRALPKQMAEVLAIAINAHAIAQEMHWTTRWVENRDGTGFWIAIDDADDKLRRDDGAPFVGPDPATPLIEAKAYYDGRKSDAR